MPSPTAVQPSDPRPVRRSAGWWATRLTVVAMLAMWVYVLYLAIGPGRQPPPDRLDDPAFAAQAEQICGAAHDRVDQLPPAISADSADQRAGIVEEANAEFARMLDDLEAIRPGGEDGELVDEWLQDWRTYLGDRTAFVAALRDDPDAQIYVSAKDNAQVTEYLDAFAADNRMPACGTPIDV